MKPNTIVLAIAAVCLLSGAVCAMESSDYRLDWFTPATGGGGGGADSTNFAVNVTVGQSVIGRAGSADYSAGLGYWYGLAPGSTVPSSGPVYLPLILKL